MSSAFRYDSKDRVSLKFACKAATRIVRAVARYVSRKPTSALPMRPAWTEPFEPPTLIDATGMQLHAGYLVFKRH